MRESTNPRRALIGAGLLALLACIWMLFKRGPAPEITTATAPIHAPPSAPGQTSPPPGRVSAVQSNPIKKALKNSSWEIVSRADATRPSFGPTAKLSLEFVRANFNAAGMRGVRQFAAFSPPQYEAIKAALRKRKDTEISAAPAELAAAGETIGFDLENAENGQEFSIDLTPKVAPDGRSIRLRTVTRGTTRRRDGTLPIWDGQTVMIPLGEAKDKRSIAAFITVRITDVHGDPVNEFVVKR